MADLEDALSPTWANVVAGQAALRDAVRRALELVTPDKSYRLAERDRDARRPAAWLASRGAPRPGRRGARVGQPVRLRAVPGPQRCRGAGSRLGPLLLPGQARGPSRGSPLERRLRGRPGGRRHPSWLDPGDGAHRDDPGRVRDGRDPVRAARPRRGSQRRPLGLHLQHHQEARRPTRVRRCPTGARYDGGAVHARLHPAARPDLPSARRPRHRRDVGLHPQPARAGGHGQRPGSRSGGQGARSRATDSTGRGWPIRTWCRSPARSSTGSSASGRTRRSASART